MRHLMEMHLTSSSKSHLRLIPRQKRPQGQGLKLTYTDRDAPERALRVNFDLRMGCSGQVLHTKQFTSTEPMSIWHSIGVVETKLDVPDASIPFAIGTGCFDQGLTHAKILELKPNKAIIEAHGPQCPSDGGDLNIDVILKPDDCKGEGR